MGGEAGGKTDWKKSEHNSLSPLFRCRHLILREAASWHGSKYSLFLLLFEKKKRKTVSFLFFFFFFSAEYVYIYIYKNPILPGREKWTVIGGNGWGKKRKKKEKKNILVESTFCFGPSRILTTTTATCLRRHGFLSFFLFLADYNRVLGFVWVFFSPA